MSDLLISDLLILLVEPSTTQQKVIMSYFNELGIDSVDAVTSGEEAIKMMGRVAPDLIVSSMHLPDITGADLLVKVRGMAELASLPFLLISSETHYRYLEPIRQAGAIAILPKPFEKSQLLSALRNTLDFIDPEALEIDLMPAHEIRVLLVDDSKLARKHIIRVLNKMGVTNIAEAENGAEGVELLRTVDVDLIVTDYNMPEMDGKEFTQYVREESNQPGVPILMVTSESDSSRLALVEDAGVSAICDKPFDQDSIRDILSRIIV
ncbi:MAG: response regulator [Gammaproteobacteria bacterium]|nr:response regulator [Gammaproteobacteria bacterium]